MSKRLTRWTVGVVGSIVLPATLVTTAGAASASTEGTTAARANTTAAQTSSAVQTGTATKTGTTETQRLAPRYRWVRIGEFRTYRQCERYNLRHNRHHYRHFCRYERVRHGQRYAWVLYWHVPHRR